MVKDQIKVTPWCCIPTPTPRYSPDKILKINVTIARSNVKSRSHQDVAHLNSLTNVCTKCQLPAPYGFQDMAHIYDIKCQGYCCKIKGQMKVTPWHCKPTPLTNVCTKYQLPILTVSKIQYRQDFKGQVHYSRIQGQITVPSHLDIVQIWWGYCNILSFRTCKWFWTICFGGHFLFQNEAKSFTNSSTISVAVNTT